MKRTPLLLFALLTLSLSFSACAGSTGQTPSATTPNLQETRVATLSTPAATPIVAGTLGQQLDSYVSQRHPLFSGVVLVAQEGQVLLSKGYNFANWEFKLPNSPTTHYRLASITKIFTALAIMQLQERGQLNIDDPICQYLEDCPAAWQAITIRQLLDHTSGIPDYTSQDNAREAARDPITVNDLIASFSDLPLDFEPGTRSAYSNSGYVLLGAIIEKISHTNWFVYLGENIWQPSGMSETGYDYNKQVLSERASGYSIEGTVFINAPYVDMSNTYAAGGLYSTLQDLYHFSQALSSGMIVKPETLEEMMTPQTVAGEPIDYGLGLQIAEVDGRRMVGHVGGLPGFNNFLAYFPDDQAVIIVLGNIDTLDAREIALSLSQVLFTN